MEETWSLQSARQSGEVCLLSNTDTNKQTDFHISAIWVNCWKQSRKSWEDFYNCVGCSWSTNIFRSLYKTENHTANIFFSPVTEWSLFPYQTSSTKDASRQMAVKTCPFVMGLKKKSPITDALLLNKTIKNYSDISFLITWIKKKKKKRKPWLPITY